MTAAPKLDPSMFPQGPYQRGQSDSYYGRRIRPHKWEDGIGRVEIVDLTEDEIAEYMRGYRDNEDAGDFKDWG